MFVSTVKLGPAPEENEYGVPLEVPSSPEQSNPEIDPSLMLQLAIIKTSPRRQ